MPPRLRKIVLAVHLACSVGWIGAVIGYIVLDAAVALSSETATVRAALISMGLIASRAIVPLAIASLLTGLVMSLGTPWGLFRYWWVVISLVLTLIAVGVLVVEATVIARLAEMAADPRVSDDQLRRLPGTLLHSVGGMAVLLVIQVLNVYKPRGLTRYGWRKQREERRAVVIQ
jgi:hypothetical protein